MKKHINKAHLFQSILIIILISVVISLSTTFIFLYSIIQSVKNIDINISSSQYINTAKFYDNNLKLINNNLETKLISYNDIPPETIDAFISIEDKDFFKHNGLNYIRIIKAGLNNLISFSYKEGASTITQQLIKNKYLSSEKTISRKIKEAYLALKLEKNEPKEKILECYLNSIYYGHGIYGIENASNYYFNKSTKDLSLNESCVLAGLIKSPYRYSPIINSENCKNRRNLVLKEMLHDKKITETEYLKNINEDITLSISSTNTHQSNLYNEFALDEASKILKLDKSKILNSQYEIYTYQDQKIQHQLDKTINNDKNYIENEYGYIADSLGIIIDNNTYGVSAVSGKSKYNLVNIKRQPGSLIKPILIYSPALEEKIIYPCSQILDEPININGYSPNNVSNKFYGYVSIEDAIAKSLNIPAVKLCNEIGINKCKEYASKCGIKFSNKDNGLSIALGGLTNGCTLKEITDAYSVYTNSGNYTNSNFIKEIKYKNKTVYNRLLSETHVFNNTNCNIIRQQLEYSVKNGTSKKLSNLPYNIAGKTGTVNIKNSNLNSDSYSLAFTSNHTMCVWLGNYSMDDKYNLSGNNNGGTFATEIIKDTFQLIYNDNIPEDFASDKNIVTLPVDKLSLNNDHEILLANNLPDRYTTYKIFNINHVPTNQSNRFNNIINDTNLKAIANNNCITLNFTTHEYYQYELYRKQNNKDIKLTNINNSEGLQQYKDFNIENNTEYFYYLKITSPINKNHIVTDYISSKISKDYSKTISQKFQTDNLSWLFN